MESLRIIFSLFFLPTFAHSIRLECNYIKSPKNYICNAADSFQITSIDDRKITELTGVHSKEKCIKDVRVLKFENIKMFYFPTGVTNYFDVIWDILIDNTGLREITHDDLKPFGKNLRTLNITNCDIKKLNADLFIDTPFVDRILFNNDQIETVESGIFSNLKARIFKISFINPCLNLGEIDRDEDDMKSEFDEIESSCGASKVDMKELNLLLSGFQELKIMVKQLTKIMT